jgi:hypothetical protein
MSLSLQLRFSACGAACTALWRGQNARPWSFYIFIALVCGIAILGHVEAQSSQLCVP